jgi:T-complex protein 1 subunit beta
LGGQILSTFDDPASGEQVMGQAELMEEIMIGESKLIKFSGCKLNQACSIVL